MRSWVEAGLLLGLISGCAPSGSWTGQPIPLGQPWPAQPAVMTPMAPPLTVWHDNPTLLPAAEYQAVWETVVDVVHAYFTIDREEPVRLVGNTLTEGRIDTFPLVGATIFEPWLHDSPDWQQRMESTLQSIRRRAVVRVIPAERGFWVEVAVFKELEDVVHPEHSTAGAATFRYDNTLTRVVNPVSEQEINEGWIPQGRDAVLEQRILGELRARFGQF